MSVTTTADELVDMARKKVQEALEAVTAAHVALNVDVVWGATDFKDEFRVTMANASVKLIVMKNDLGERRYFD